MAAEERTIELTIVSATDLKKVKRFGLEQRCYAEAYIYPAHKAASQVDNYGGVNPTWNSKLTLTCYESLLHQPDAAILVDIFSHGTLFSSSKNKLVGTVTIPLEHALANECQVLAFPVVGRKGGDEGILNLSMKLGEKRTLGQYEDPAAPRMASYSDDPS